MRNRITNLADIFDREEESRAARYYASYGGFNFNRSLAKLQRINDKMTYAFESLEEIENDRETMANIRDQLDYNISLGKGISVESAAIINSNINNIYNRYGIVNKTAIVALEGFESGNSRLEYTQKLRVSIEEGFFEKVKNVIKEIWEWIKKQWARFIDWIKGGAEKAGNALEDTINKLTGADPNEQQVYSRSWYAKVRNLMARFINAFKKFFKSKTEIEKINERLAALDKREKESIHKYTSKSYTEYDPSSGKSISKVKSVPEWSTTFIVGPIMHAFPPTKWLVNYVCDMKDNFDDEKEYIKSERDKLNKRKEDIDAFNQSLDDKDSEEISNNANKAANLGGDLLTESQTNGEMLELMKRMLKTFNQDKSAINENANQLQSLINQCEKKMREFSGRDDKTTAKRNKIITKILKDQFTNISNYVSVYYQIIIKKANEAATASKKDAEINDDEMQAISVALNQTLRYTDSNNVKHDLREEPEFKKKLEERLKSLQEKRNRAMKAHNDKWDKDSATFTKNKERDQAIFNRFGGGNIQGNYDSALKVWNRKF